MKKIIYFVLPFILLLIPTNAYAANDISINCGKTKLNKNEEVSCTIAVNNLNFTATDITGKVQTGSNLSITSSSYDRNVWLSLATNFTVADIDLMRNEVTKKNSLTIATFKVKASSTASGTSTITFGNVAMGNDLYQSIPLATKTINITFNSNVNTLSSLSVEGKQLDFSSDKTNYSLTIDNPSVSISATPTHSGARVSGTGTRNLNYGNNTINVVVTAEDGSTKTYVLNITRPDKRSANNNLKSLSLSNGTIKFNKSTTNYNVEVADNVDKVTIKADTEDSKASFESGLGPRTVNLAYGDNKVQIKVKAENGSIKVYTININRKDNRNTNNNLKSITLSDGQITFDEKITEYTVNVPFEVEKMNVKAEAANSKSKVEVNGTEEIVVGENIFTIKVTAENGAVKEYKIKVIRDEKVIITNSNKIKNIIVEGHELVFDPETYNYTIKTKDSMLNIKVELNDEESTYKINGNENLKDGSIISITVTDKDGNNSIYKISIEEENNFDLTIILLFISLGLNLLFLIIIIILLAKKKNNDNSDKQNDEKNVPIPITPTPTEEKENESELNLEKKEEKTIDKEVKEKLETTTAIETPEKLEQPEITEELEPINIEEQEIINNTDEPVIIESKKAE